MGLHPIREALRAGRRRLDRLRVGEGAPPRELAELEALARAAGVPLAEAEPERPAGATDRGRPPAFLLEAGPVPVLGLDELLGRAGGEACLVALDGVEDPQNLGAILRSSEGAGALGVVVTQRRAAPLSPAVSRASAGALEHLPVARVTNLARALERMKEKGFWVLGADQDAGEDLFACPSDWTRGPLVVVLGAEGRGIRPGISAQLDHRVRIPMQGRVGSLNVASAAAVVLYEVRRRRVAASG